MLKNSVPRSFPLCSGMFRLFAFCVLLSAFLFAGCSKEAKKNRVLAKANRDFVAGRYDQAEIGYIRVRQIDPADPVPIARLGVIYFEQGRLVDARRFLGRGVELLPDDAEVRLKLCLTEFALSQSGAARTNALLIFRKEPGQPEAGLVLAATASTSKDIVETTNLIAELRRADKEHKDRAGYHLALAELYLRQGQIPNAWTEASQALALDPKVPATLMFLGRLYWSSNDLQRAELAFKTGVDLSPLRSPHRLEQVDFKLKTGHGDEAKKLLETLTQAAPDYLPAWIYRAQVAFGENQLGDCAANLQRVLARDPTNLKAALLDCAVKLRKNESLQAITQLQRLDQIYTRSPEIQLYLAKAYAMNGEEAKSEACFRQVRNLAPPESNARFEAITELARLAIKNGDANSAALELELLLKNHPDVVQAYSLLADAYTRLRKPDQALGVYRRMQQRFPKSPTIPYAIANIQAQQNQRDEARTNCFRALELASNNLYLPPLELLVTLDLNDHNPKAAFDLVTHQIQSRTNAVPELQVLLARIYLNQKDYPNAEATLLKTIQMAPDFSPAYLVLANYYRTANKAPQAIAQLTALADRTSDMSALLLLGMIQESLKNYPAARDAYARLLKINPKFWLALNNLAYLYSEHLDRLDEAVRLAEQARQFFPFDPNVADTLGWILYRKGDYPRAISMLQQAAESRPEDLEVQFHLGMVRYTQGQEGPARMALEQALGSKNDFPGLEEARLRVAILTLAPNANDPATQSLLEKRIAQDPKDVVALTRLAVLYSHNGAPEKAVRLYEQALPKNPRNGAVLTGLAQIYAAPGKLNDPHKALKYATDAHAVAPNDAAISQILGHLACEAGDYKWAHSLLEEAASAFPKQPSLLFDLARSGYGLGKLDAARTALQAALDANAAFDHADEAKQFLLMLTAYQESGARQAVAAQLPAILRADSNNIPALMVSQLIQQEEHRFEEARKTLERVLKLSPKFAPAQRDLAILYFNRFPDEGRTAELVAEALQYFPEDADLARVLGLLAYRRGDYSSAERFLKQSVRTLSRDAELFYYLGKAQHRLNSIAEGRKSFQRALELKLAPTLAADAKRLLGE